MDITKKLQDSITFANTVTKNFFFELLNFLSYIRDFFLKIVQVFITFKKTIIIFFIIYILYKIIKYFWKNKETVSKFLWLPEPVIGGVSLSLFGQFYKNHLTQGLLELQNLLDTLPKSIPIIIVLGQVDNFDNIITLYKSDALTWFFLRNNIYIYIAKNEDTKFVASFLNKIRNTKPVNSIVIKIKLEDDIPTETLNAIAMITSIQTALYIVFENIKWSHYLGEFLDHKNTLGFLINKNDTMSIQDIRDDLQNIKMYIWEKMLKKNKTYDFDFWFDFNDCIENLVDKIYYAYNLETNILRGVFFTSTDNRRHINNLLNPIDEKNKEYFTNYYQEVVELETLLSIPINTQKILYSRYEKYKNNLFILSICIISIFFLNMNINLWSFNKQYNEYLIQSNNLLENYINNDSENNYNKKNKNNKTDNIEDSINTDTNNNQNYSNKTPNKKKYSIFILYELISKLNKINLNKIYYHYTPHIYLINNIYEMLCEIQELLIFSVLDKKIIIDENENYSNMEEIVNKTYEQLSEYIITILDFEHNVFSNTPVKRFGIYYNRHNTNTKNTQILLSKSFSDIRDNYFILLNNFLKKYCDKSTLNQIEELKKSLNIFFSNSEVNIYDLQNLSNQITKLNINIKNKNNQLHFKNFILLFARMEISNIFGSSTVLESNLLINDYLNKYFLDLTSVEQTIVGPILKINNSQIELGDKLLIIFNDINRFLLEPFMANLDTFGPRVPDDNVISSWNINMLKETITIKNQSNEFKEKVSTYSLELRNIFYKVFEKKLITSIWNKIGISQNTVPLDHINIQNLSEAFLSLEIILDFFLEEGNMDYYYKIIQIIYHDLMLIDRLINKKIHNTIFYSIEKIRDLKKDNVQEFLCLSTKDSKIQEYLDKETDILIQTYNTFMLPLIRIFESNHFKNYRGVQYTKYLSIGYDINRFNKGLNNNIKIFNDFFITNLKTYSIYDSFNDNFDWDHEEGFLADLLFNLKKEIIEVSQKLYVEELVYSYQSLRYDYNYFEKKFPFSTIYDTKSLVSIEELYTFIKKFSKTIKLLNKHKIFIESLNNNLYKLKTLDDRILCDEHGIFINFAITYNTYDLHNKNQYYIGLININHTYEYAKYLIQEEVKLYFNQPIYIHIEILHNYQIQILPHHHDFFRVIRTTSGIRLEFDNFWAFLYYIHLHEESRTNDNITIIVNIPIKVGNMVTNIKFNVTLKNFIFFPNYLPKNIQLDIKNKQ